MENNFNQIASGILQESIKSAIFIDDRIRLPFDKSTDAELLDYSELLAPFENKGCTLSFYRYNNEWSNQSNFLFSNRDLLILDWQLKKNQDTYSDTLELLGEAVGTNSLHFCCIYTDTNPNDFENKIIFPILAHFGYCVRAKKEELESAKSKFVECCEREGLDSESVLLGLNPLCREFLIYSFDEEKKKSLMKDILEFLKKTFKDFVAVRREFLTLTGDLSHSFAMLAYAFDEMSIPTSNSSYRVRLGKSDQGAWRIYVNNTLLTLANKDNIKEQVFYDEFTNSLIDDHNLFLTLLGLEMRNSFRRGSGFIGQGLEDISEIAFFYHHKNIKPKYAFYEFLRELWVDQATHFLHINDPELYSAIDEYKIKRNIGTQVENFESKLSSEVRFQNDLVKLNNFYNQLRFNPNEYDLISFGDVFKFESSVNTFEYVICVTPLCDCAESAKINNQYMFVKHENLIGSAKRALTDAEGEYFSYLIEDSKIICLDWGECKPFSLYVENPKILRLSPIVHLNKVIKLQYLGRIKEKFAQRIANKALSYPARVGVSLAQIPSTKEIP